jgi:hypothetical protein
VVHTNHEAKNDPAEAVPTVLHRAAKRTRVTKDRDNSGRWLGGDEQGCETPSHRWESGRRYAHTSKDPRSPVATLVLVPLTQLGRCKHVSTLGPDDLG